MPKSRILQLSEYDVTQKIIEALSNVCYRAILFSVKDEAKDTAKIASELGFSLSAVYAGLRRLEELALVKRRYHLDGKKKIKIYRSRISRVEILMEDNEPELKLFPTDAESNSNT